MKTNPGSDSSEFNLNYDTIEYLFVKKLFFFNLIDIDFKSIKCLCEKNIRNFRLVYLKAIFLNGECKKI